MARGSAALGVARLAFAASPAWLAGRAGPRAAGGLPAGLPVARIGGQQQGPREAFPRAQGSPLHKRACPPLQRPSRALRGAARAMSSGGSEGDGGGLFEAGSSFEGLGLDPRLVAAVQDMGFSRPTRIQAAGLSPIIEGKDVVLGAETGSGKTLAYLLPVLHAMLARGAGAAAADEAGEAGVEEGGEPAKADRRPSVLVLVPNQELANQVLRVLDSLALGEAAAGAVVAGAQGLARGSPCRVLIATPSGVMRHTDPHLLALVRTVVVDEADMLLEGGFLDDVVRILGELKPAVTKGMMRRAKGGDQNAMELPRQPSQLVFAAATLPDWKGDKVKSVVRWIKKRYPEAYFVQTDNLHKESQAAKQVWIDVPGQGPEALLSALDAVLEEHGGKRTMVFVNTVATAIAAHAHLTQGIDPTAQVLHKEMGQMERAESIAAFRAGAATTLISTDLGSRGLDIPLIEHVIQLELATNAVTHLHRIGRTARAGATGLVTNLVDDSSRAMAEAIMSEEGNALAPVFSRNRGFNRRKKRYGSGKAVLE